MMIGYRKDCITGERWSILRLLS